MSNATISAGIIAGLALAIWVYLVLGRGGFWRPLVLPAAPAPARWPSVAAIVPARNEADVVAAAIGSLLAEDYPGSFNVVLVDDHSSDGTADIARAAAARLGRADHLTVIDARGLPRGWTGKLWALAEGVRALEAEAQPDLYLFTDADIAHPKGDLAALVRVLEARQLDLASLMVRLRSESRVERWLVPAFVFFFAMLYPFRWVNDERRRTAAAAGGTMLVRAAAYHRIGGYEAISGALIDDCALARALKGEGRVFLALTQETHSLRAYPRLADWWSMVARTAYTELDHSPLKLMATVLGLGITFLAPPALMLAGGVAMWLGAAAWAMMAAAYLPMLRFYRLSPLRAPFLPAIACVYLTATLGSALAYYRGRGGAWKGRVQWQR